MDSQPSSSKKSKLDIPSNAKLCGGLLIPKISGPLPSMEERFEIYMIDAEPLLEYASAGFRLFVSRFTDQILINYISLPEFDVPHKSLANKFRWLYVIRQVWLKLDVAEKNACEKSAKTKRCKIDDSYFDFMLYQAIQQNLFEQSYAYQERLDRANKFKHFIDETADDVFITPSQMTFLVDFSPMQISPHVINFFKVCINLDYFLDTLFEMDAERTSELIKYAIFYSKDKSDPDLRMSLKLLMPSLKTADQCDWIIGELRKHNKHFDVRELSLFPLNVLERFFRRFNPIDYGEERARSVRNQAIDLGVVDMILDCLSFFAHQKARCKRLRPSHMDIAHFQIDYMTERRFSKADTQKKTQQASTLDGDPWEIAMPTFGHIEFQSNEDDVDFEYYAADNLKKINEAIESQGINLSAKNVKSKKGGKKGQQAKQTKQKMPTEEPQYYQSYAGADNVPIAMNPSIQPTTVNSGAINRRQKKPHFSIAENQTATITEAPKKPNSYNTSKFAKGTGYGSGTSNSVWNVSEHVAKKKYEMGYVTALLKILQAFIKPKSPILEELLASSASSDFNTAKEAFLSVALSDAGDGCSMIDEKLLQLLNRSCLRKTLLSYLVNDSLLDITQNKESYETVFGLLAAIAQTGYVKAFASLFVIDNEEEDSSDDDNVEDNDCEMNVDELAFTNEPCASSSLASTASNQQRGRRRTSGRIEQQKIEKAKTLTAKKDSRASSSISVVAEKRIKMQPRKVADDADVEVEHTHRQCIDIFHFLFLDNWFAKNGRNYEEERSSQPLLLKQLNTVSSQIDCYLARMFSSSGSHQIQKQQKKVHNLLCLSLSADDLEMVSSDDEDRLRNLSFLSKLICAVIERKMILAESVEDNDVHMSSPTSTRKANGGDEKEKEKELEQLYCRQMKPLQFETIPFYVAGSNQLAVSYKYHQDIAACAASAFGKNIRRITQEIVSLSSALPLSASSSVFIRSSEERIHAAKMLITGPSGTPYANGCFEFDIHFPNSYPAEPMRVNLQTTGNGSVRFNPNLYNCGKVCLSVLNTWSGRPEERWNPDTSSLLQVIVSLQSLVLVPEPYFNEPGFQNSIGTTSGQKNSANYNSTIRVATVRWAMLEMLRSPPRAFASVVRRHFFLKRFEIRKQVEAWIAEERQNSSANCKKLEADYARLKELLDALTKAKDVAIDE